MLVRIFKRGNNWVVQPTDNGKTFFMPTLRLALDLAYESIQLSDREHSHFIFGHADSDSWRDTPGGEIPDVDEGDSPWQVEFESPFTEGGEATTAA